jgi:hypothetical protein
MNNGLNHVEFLYQQENMRQYFKTSKNRFLPHPINSSFLIFPTPEAI